MNAWRRVQSRIRDADPLRFDIAITALFLVAWIVELTLIADWPSDEKLTTGIFGVLAILPLALRRRVPLFPPLALAVVCVASETVTDSFLVDESTVPFTVFFFELYTLGRYVDGTRLLVGAGAAIAGLVVALTLQSAPAAQDVFWLAFLLGAPLLAGRAIRNRTRLNRELREKAERAEREREQQAAEAIERERSRIATELQTVVANGVSAMVVQAEAVPRLLDGGEPARASQALAVIEETGRDALAEMRRLLGVLRHDDEGAERAPQPSLRRVDALVGQYRADGLEVELAVEGERPELAPGVELAGFRVLEQSLATARQDEAHRAEVTIRYGERDVELEISDDRSPEAEIDHAELAALRDRLSIYGGHLSAGPSEQGGFAVRARLPREAT